jgi:membrane-bound lytic murein transglycosylase D
MKTMTKRNFIRTGLLCNGLLIIITTHAGNLNDPNENLPVKRYVLQQTDVSDTVLIPAEKLDSPVSIIEEIIDVQIPEVPLNKQAVTYIANYMKVNEESLVKIRNTCKSHFKIIESILSKHQLPLEMKYLAVIESKLKNNAVSHAGAAGPWQIMPATARYLGLKVSSANDERKNLYKSTQAAAKYLKELYNIYEDWLLVIAAYNAGPGNVNKAIKKSGSKNFWALQYDLPAETRNHVKRFIGAHYFFEETGSETTLTKAERLKYEQKVAMYTQEVAAKKYEVAARQYTESVAPLHVSTANEVQVFTVADKK